MVVKKSKPTVKDTKRYFENQVLDAEEQQIQDDLAAGLYVVPKDMARRLAELKQAAINTIKKKPITVRIQSNDLLQLKHLAGKKGIPYQTLVTSVLHRYVTGQLKGDA